MLVQITVVAANKSGSDVAYTCAFWLNAPANNVIPDPNFTSAVASPNATDLAALKAGTLVEELWSTGLLPASTTGSALKALAVAAYTAAQTALTATNPPLNVIGVTYNGTTWSA